MLNDMLKGRTLQCIWYVRIDFEKSTIAEGIGSIKFYKYYLQTS